MIKNEKQIEAIKRAAVVNNGLLDYIEEHIQIGMTTQDIDDMAVAYTSSHGGYSADLNEKGILRVSVLLSMMKYVMVFLEIMYFRMEISLM